MQIALAFYSDWRKIHSEDDAMKPLLQLNLQDNSQKPEQANLPDLDRREPESPEVLKRMNQIANRVAHKAGAEYGRYSSGIFSK